VSIRDDIATIVRHVVGDYRYERSYPCQVVRSYDDGVVRGIGMQSIPATSLAPATFALAEPGCRGLLAFVAGDPSRPTITTWDYAQNSATIYIDGGVASVARKGDLIDVMLTVAGTPISGMVEGAVTAPGPVVTPVAAVQFTGLAVLSAVRAVIIGGAATIKA
jgi:hypothetical protein